MPSCKLFCCQENNKLIFFSDIYNSQTCVKPLNEKHGSYTIQLVFILMSNGVDIGYLDPKKVLSYLVDCRHTELVTQAGFTIHVISACVLNVSIGKINLGYHILSQLGLGVKQTTYYINDNCPSLCKLIMQHYCFHDNK